MASLGDANHARVEPTVAGIDEHRLTDVSARGRKASARAVFEACKHDPRDGFRRLDLNAGRVRFGHALPRRVHDSIENEGENDHKRQC